MLSKEQHVMHQRQVEDPTSTPQVTQLKLHQTQKQHVPASNSNSTLASRCWETLRVTGVVARTNNRSRTQRISFTNGWPVWLFYLLVFLTPLPLHSKTPLQTGSRFIIPHMRKAQKRPALPHNHNTRNSFFWEVLWATIKAKFISVLLYVQ